MDFKRELSRFKEETDRAIYVYLPEEDGFQKTLIKASNYSVENGGKRLRPIFMRLAYELCQREKESTHEWDYRDGEIVFPFMAAIEMIHSSSLTHDDLPCMDNDVLRRGKESTWARFGEAMGTLAGDSLLLYAFETACKSMADPTLKSRAIEILSSKAGVFGMTGGQSVDVELSGRRPSQEELDFIYIHKTGALIEAAFMIGAVLAGASDETIAKLEKAAGYIGLAFQIKDDILDLEGDQETLGKSPGQDERLGKNTWPTLFGLEKAKSDVSVYSEKALSIFKDIARHCFLEKLVTYLICRDS